MTTKKNVGQDDARCLTRASRWLQDGPTQLQEDPGPSVSQMDPNDMVMEEEFGRASTEPFDSAPFRTSQDHRWAAELAYVRALGDPGDDDPGDVGEPAGGKSTSYHLNAPSIRF